MKRFILLTCVVLLCGCAGYRISHVHGNISGNSLTTPYGPASGNLAYDAVTCLGHCPKGCYNEVINGQ